jgi:DNA-binding Xre family transcriptional regulator
MINSNLQFNLEVMLAKKNLDISEFYTISGINALELESLLEKRTLSICHPTLNKITNALGCTLNELFSKPSKTKSLKKSKLEFNNTVKYKELLPSFSNINIDLFSESVAKVDEIITSEGKKICPLQKAKAYLAFYELAEKFAENE